MTRNNMFSRHFIEKNSQILAQMIENELTEKQKEYITMRIDGGKTYAQIAKECGVNRSTVYRTVKRGTERIYGLMDYITKINK